MAKSRESKPTEHREMTVEEYKRRLASIGGKARAEQLSSKKRKEIATKAAKQRWAKAKKAAEQ